MSILSLVGGVGSFVGPGMGPECWTATQIAGEKGGHKNPLRWCGAWKLPLACAHSLFLLLSPETPPQAAWSRGRMKGESRQCWDWGQCLITPTHACAKRRHTSPTARAHPGRGYTSAYDAQR